MLCKLLASLNVPVGVSLWSEEPCCKSKKWQAGEELKNRKEAIVVQREDNLAVIRKGKRWSQDQTHWQSWWDLRRREGDRKVVPRFVTGTDGWMVTLEWDWTLWEGNRECILNTDVQSAYHLERTHLVLEFRGLGRDKGVVKVLEWSLTSWTMRKRQHGRLALFVRTHKENA